MHPGGGQVDGQRAARDRDAAELRGDGYTDLDDYSILQNCYSGDDIFANPACQK